MICIKIKNPEGIKTKRRRKVMAGVLLLQNNVHAHSAQAAVAGDNFSF